MWVYAPSIMEHPAAIEPRRFAAWCFRPRAGMGGQRQQRGGIAAVPRPVWIECQVNRLFCCGVNLSLNWGSVRYWNPERSTPCPRQNAGVLNQATPKQGGCPWGGSPTKHHWPPTLQFLQLSLRTRVYTMCATRLHTGRGPLPPATLLRYRTLRDEKLRVQPHRGSATTRASDRVRSSCKEGAVSR